VRPSNGSWLKLKNWPHIEFGMTVIIMRLQAQHKSQLRFCIDPSGIALYGASCGQLARSQ